MGASKMANADDISISGTTFGQDEFGLSAEFSTNVKNNTDKTIKAWKGDFVCLDAFGDKVINIKVVSRSANIEPKGSRYSGWKISFIDTGADVIMNNDASNFKCSINNQQIVY